MIIGDYLKYWKICWKFKDYKPQPLTIKNIKSWLNQFDVNDQKFVMDLLGQILYFSEKETKKALLDNNKKIIQQLEREGVNLKKIIYISFGDAGSSSHVMLSVLRDTAGLERRPCHLFDSNNIRGLFDHMTRLGDGVIIYIDDFIGTGGQFCEARKAIAENLPLITNFSEFLIVPSICEEGYASIKQLGIDIFHSGIHTTNDRPLHKNNLTLSADIKSRLILKAKKIDSRDGLGYADMATMVIFYRNTPNTVPRIFRGNMDQSFKGILPRTTDLPPKTF